MSNKNADDTAKKLGITEKSIGFFARTFNRYRGSDETPFSWFSSLVSFGSDTYYTDTPSFQEICDREGLDINDAERKMRVIRLRSRLYFTIAFLYSVTVILIEIMGHGSHLVLMLLELSISAMFTSWAVRLSFWAFQTQYGISNPDKPLPSFNMFLKHSEHWL